MSVISNETVLSVRKESDSAGEVDVPAATLNEQGDRVHCFSYHDAPRQAHYIAAQGGSTSRRTTATTSLIPHRRELWRASTGGGSLPPHIDKRKERVEETVEYTISRRAR